MTQAEWNVLMEQQAVLKAEAARAFDAYRLASNRLEIVSQKLTDEFWRRAFGQHTTEGKDV